MQIKPSAPLSGIIRHFLVIESDRRAAMRIFSDGNTGIVFNYGDALFYEAEIHAPPEILPANFVYGQLDRYRNVRATGKVRLLIAVLYPFGASALFGIPASELRNQIVGFGDFYARDASFLADEIAVSGSIPEKIQAVERFLLARLPHSIIGNTLISSAVSIIHARNGLLPVMQLVEILGVTERRLQRGFEEQVGVSPKRYAGIIRMQHALRMLRYKTGDMSFAAIACDSGFFDQAHLIREMKNLSGLTPGQYLDPQNLLAANLIQIGPRF